MQNQTEMAFADGGLPVDPVSGNEVPPGSLPEEVRDDIKVGVSEGEYIVPADVLRYYGMKFFEDLRAEAKVALGGMEQEGRMGGEPMMEAPMEEQDDLPFSTEELQATDDMNEGGYMRGYYNGGLQTPDAAAEAYPDTQMGSIFGSGGIQYVTYYGPNGETITIQTFNGNPMSPVPAGYTASKPVAAAPASTAAGQVAAAPAPSNDRDRPDRLEAPERKKPSEMTDAELGSALGQIGGFGEKFGMGLGTAIGGMFGGPVGALGMQKLMQNSAKKSATETFNELKGRIAKAQEAGDTGGIAAYQKQYDDAFKKFEATTYGDPDRKPGFMDGLFNDIGSLFKKKKVDVIQDAVKQGDASREAERIKAVQEANAAAALSGGAAISQDTRTKKDRDRAETSFDKQLADKGVSKDAFADKQAGKTTKGYGGGRAKGGLMTNKKKK